MLHPLILSLALYGLVWFPGLAQDLHAQSMDEKSSYQKTSKLDLKANESIKRVLGLTEIESPERVGDAKSAPRRLTGSWDSRFSNPILFSRGAFGLGPSMSRHYFMSEIEGELYVAGDFVDAGGFAAADALARWDGRQWHAAGVPDLGNGARIFAFVSTDDGLYVGGDFEIEGGNLWGIGLWDGEQWRRLGQGIICPITRSCEVRAVVLDGSDLYVGGKFDDAGGKANADQIARFDGVEWHPLGAGLDDDVYAMALHNGELIVGGEFRNAGDFAGDYIAKWDGSEWHSLGGGLSDAVSTIVSDGTNLYVGGEFTMAGRTAGTNHVARWDGLEWHSLGGGLDSDVHSLLLNDGDLLAAGEMGVMRWTGVEWEPLETEGRAFEALSLARVGETLYAGTSPVFGKDPFNSAGPRKWEDDQWRFLSDGIPLGITLPSFSVDPEEEEDEAAAYAILVHGTDIYVGGLFHDVGGIPEADILVRWDGNEWHNIGRESPPGPVLALTMHNEQLVAGGVFENAGGLSLADNVAVFDGANWENVGTGLNAGVAILATVDNELYAGGAFTDAGGDANADYLARWDGASWRSVGPGLTGNVLALAFGDDGIYAGGHFEDVGGDPMVDRIARWNGAMWESIGGGLNGSVRTIVLTDTGIFVGGDFTDAGGNMDADRVALWNGSSWENLGSGLNGTVTDLHFKNGILVATGYFANAGDDPFGNSLAYWDGVSWKALGGGFFRKLFKEPSVALVNALAVDDDNIYLAGNFTHAGDGTQVSGFGIYSGFEFQGSGVRTEPLESIPATPISFNAYPNPVVERATISATVDAPQFVRVGVFDVLGRRIAMLHEGMMRPGTPQTWTWLPQEAADGMYIVRIVGESFRLSKPLARIR